MRCLLALDRLIGRITAAAALLVIPLALLLCLQWPLRDLLHAYATQANDLAQLFFGVYVSVALTAATRTESHLTPDLLARRYSPKWRRLALRVVSVGVVLPWSAFVLWAAWPIAGQSLAQWESFPDTFNPGYFVLKLALLLLALLMAVQTVLGLLLPPAKAPR